MDFETVIHHFAKDGRTFSKTVFKEWNKLETDIERMEAVFKSPLLIEMLKYFGEL